MVFTTWPFFFFMIFVFAFYWWIAPRRWRAPFLLAASFAYFTYNYPPHALLLGGLTLFVYLAGELIFRLRNRGNTAGQPPEAESTENGHVTPAISANPVTGKAALIV